MTTARLTAGTNKNERRIWIEGYINPAVDGLKFHTPLYRTMNDDGSMTLSTTPDPEVKQRKHKVVGKPGRELIDLSGKWVTAFMGGHRDFIADISPAGIVITPC